MFGTPGIAGAKERRWLKNRRTYPVKVGSGKLSEAMNKANPIIPDFNPNVKTKVEME